MTEGPAPASGSPDMTDLSKIRNFSIMPISTMASRPSPTG